MNSMKRKSSQIYTACPSPRDLCGERSSKSRLKATASGEVQGIGYKERVRFTDIGNDEIQVSDSVPLERNQDRRSDDPKTSEYAFFKKLKKDAGHRFHSLSLDRDKNQPVNFKSCEYSRESIKNRHKDFKSSLLQKDATPDNFVSFLSPLGIASKKSWDMKRSGTTLVDAQSTQESMDKHRVQFENADIFTRKRQKLRQLVANTSSAEVDELCSKGCNFVSALLSKLFPDSNDDRSFEFLEASKSEIYTKSPESDMYFQKSNWMPKRKFLKLEYGPSLDIDFSSCRSEIPLDREPKRNFIELEHRPFLDVGFSSSWSEIPTQRDTKRNFMELECGPSLDVGFLSCWSEIPTERELPNPNSPGCHFHRNLDNRIMNFDCELGDRTAPIVCTGDDSAFDFHIGKHKSLATEPVKELENFEYLFEPLHGRKPHTLLLGCELDNMTDRELSLCTIISSSSSEDELQNQDNRFSASGIDTQPLFSYCPRNLRSLQFSPSTDNTSHNFEECSLEVKNDIVAVINNFSLCSSHAANHQNLIEYSHCDTKFRDSSILLSPQNHLWFLNERHSSSKEALFTTGIDFYLEPKCISFPSCVSSRDHYSYTFPALEFSRNERMSSQFLTGDENANCLDGLSNREMMKHEDNMVDIHDWSTYYFQKTRPLLLDKSYRDESEGEFYSDDSEVKF